MILEEPLKFSFRKVKWEVLADIEYFYLAHPFWKKMHYYSEGGLIAVIIGVIIHEDLHKAIRGIRGFNSEDEEDIVQHMAELSLEFLFEDERKAFFEFEV